MRAGEAERRGDLGRKPEGGGPSPGEAEKGKAKLLVAAKVADLIQDFVKVGRVVHAHDAQCRAPFGRPQMTSAGACQGNGALAGWTWDGRCGRPGDHGRGRVWPIARPGLVIRGAFPRLRRCENVKPGPAAYAPRGQIESSVLAFRHSSYGDTLPIVRSIMYNCPRASCHVQGTSGAGPVRSRFFL